LLPAVSLPKGGGAIRSIGEKFSVNPSTGTASISVPLVATPGRSGFGPQLQLSYDSGAGNGPFGFGWSLSLPAVTRKTDKGLPRYGAGGSSDVFLLSGAEDLVPILDGNDKAVSFDRTLNRVDYSVELYRPRIEGLYARIEKWTEKHGDRLSHWRTITRENVTTLFGLDDLSRIADPKKPGHIFAYLIRRSFDDKGNAIEYTYVAEDDRTVDKTAAHEINRDEAARTTQRYVKSISYANDTPYIPNWDGQADPTAPPAAWRYKIVLDYGDHAPAAPTPDRETAWPVRPDPYSQYRAGFEVRTYRRCRRVLLFHDFPEEVSAGQDCLVRSSDFVYTDEAADPPAAAPLYTTLRSVTQTGYRRSGVEYIRRALPPLEFGYSEVRVQPDVLKLDDPESGANLPEGLSGRGLRWIDLFGEGVSGVLRADDTAWFYKPNLSPAVAGAPARLGAIQEVSSTPAPRDLGVAQLLDLSGDGRLDLAIFELPAPGFYHRAFDNDWDQFQPFRSLPALDWKDANLRFVDLTGDGLPDILRSVDEAFEVHESLGEAGFAAEQRLPSAPDEDLGPRVVFADGTQTVSLADMTGDGLTDIVRVRNGEVCYWPNLGYGAFGAKVLMGGAPTLADSEQFDPQRVRWADVDGSGTADLVYLGTESVRVHFNQSGNAFSTPAKMAVFPTADNLSSVQVIDLLGTGTACLVWSTPLPGHGVPPTRYVDLMGSTKPHLLTSLRNNLGAETRVAYAPSTRFAVRDRLAGRPWLTRLPFPVQVVERVETYDWIGRSRFVSRYAYRDGYYDGVEREFRGFAMVEQRDTGVYRDDTLFPEVDETDEDRASHVPPAVTRSWFHTGAFLDTETVSQQFAHQYWTESAFRGDDPASVAGRAALLLPDSVIDGVLAPSELREAYRALKGSTLRTEVYAEDSEGELGNPYVVTEQSFAARQVQKIGPNQHGVFVVHPREMLSYHYERQENDPRIEHAVTLEVDDFGNVLRSVSVTYGRRPGPNPEPQLSMAVQATLAHDQSRVHIGAVQHILADPLHRPDEGASFDEMRGPHPAETITAELTGIAPAAARFTFDELDGFWGTLWDGAHDVPYEEISSADIDGVAVPTPAARRIVGRNRVLYRKNDLTALLPLSALESRALPGETYTLALTDSLLQRVFAARVTDAILTGAGYVQMAGTAGWWRPSGRVFYSAGDNDAPAVELAEATAHFYLPRRAVDPFRATTRVRYAHDLLPVESVDAIGNVTTVANDYGIGQPASTTDPNGSIHTVVYDCLGDVVGTAITGSAGEGDSFQGFDIDLTDNAARDAHERPLANADALIANATSRIVHDRHAYFLTRDLPQPDAPTTYTITRETHTSDLAVNQRSRLHHLFVYSDGMGREAQHKGQAEPGPLVPGGPIADPRWIGSGWTLYDNKGHPVRKYEPFFTDTHLFEFGRRAGVSSIMCYDPLGREVAALHPDSTFEKTVFDAWREDTWDANDTVQIGNPRTDPDVGAQVTRVLGNGPFTSWYDARIGGTLGADAADRAASQDAAQKAAAHAGTPTISHLDSLGRRCLTVTDNAAGGRYPTRTAMDTESKPLAVIDALGRRVTEYCVREPLAGGGFRYVGGYDLLGEPIYHNNLDNGERRLLPDVAGRPIRSWDARGAAFRLEHDALHRLTHRYVTRGAAAEILLERYIFGDRHPDAARNLKGHLFRQYDGAGMSSHERYDFKGNLLDATRQLPVRAAAGEPQDWSALANLGAPNLDVAALDAAANPALDAAQRYVSHSQYDAMNRPVQMLLPHDPAKPVAVVQTTYNEALLLETVHAWLRRAAAPNGLLDVATADVNVVTGVDYNEHGQRITVNRAGGVVTTQTFDEQTRRLTSLVTTRPNPDADARVVQALRYTYDPHGNITRLRDDADLHNVVFFQNRRVEPSSDYTYDAIYRIVAATGREHLGQTGGVLNPPQQVTSDDGPRSHTNAGARLLNPGDGQAMATYTEAYEYDPVGNLKTLTHRVGNAGWTRHYAYDAPGRITAADVGNRLTSTSNPGDPDAGPYSAHYDHDEHGNMTWMPHLPVMVWDELDRLVASSKQVVNSGTPETTFYAYEAGGERTRKLTYRQAAAGAHPTLKTERIYLGAIEIYREFDPDGTLALERETAHGLLDHRRMVMVETRTVDAHGTDQAPAQLQRHQYSTHLGSATLELDDQAAVVSYEEYFPYGSTAYQAVRRQTDVPKRYRFTGEERDEENDLYYHGGRYYAPWLGRWTACDPAGMSEGPNLYVYVHGNPVVISDPTGMWGWREVAIVAAVVVVGTVVTVATAGVAGPIVAGAVASVGLSGAAATVATGVVVGAVAGAAGGAASELTRQVASGEQVSGRAIGRAALEGAALGAVTGGLSAYASTARGAAQVARASTAIRASSVGRAGAAVARAASAGGRAVARVPGARQIAGAAQALTRSGSGALQSIERGGQNLGIRAGRALFAQGSTGAQAVGRFADFRNAAQVFDRPFVRTGRYDAVRGHHIHQGASYGTGSARATNPNYDDAVTIAHGPGFTRVDHRAADAVQRNLNRGLRGATVNDPQIRNVNISATGSGTSVGTPSPWFEDVKGYYSLRAAGQSPTVAHDIVTLSNRQLEQAGANIPVRVPSR
jgi:RHS repeat-associated protein